MTGDSHSNDDADFLDEDFVIEDLVGKNDDLEDLFDEPAHPEADSAAKEEEAEGDPEQAPDEDDMLFSDHTEGIEASEEFHKPVFAEDGANEWDGDHLDLESVGVPDATAEGEEEAADPQIDEAKESFAAELDSLLHEEEDDFAHDSEADLELVNLSSEIDDGISEFEQSGPFVLDDGDGLWADELEEGSADEVTADDVVADQPVVDEPVLEDVVGEDFAVDEEVVAEQPTRPVASYESLSQHVPGADAGFEDIELGVDAAEDADSFDLELDGTDDEGVPQEQELEDEGITLVSPADQLVSDAFGEGQTVVSDGPMSIGEDVNEDESLEDMPLRNADAFADGSEQGEAGWEPLPSTSMDELSEVDEVQRTDDGEEEYDVSGYEEDEPEAADEEGYEDSEEYAGEYAEAETDLDDVDGHDIYAEEGTDKRGVVLGGPGSRRSTASLLLSVAASLLVLFGAAMVVVRPELFGLSVDPERVAKVDVARPKVEVAVVEPPKVGLQNDVIVEPNPVKTSNPAAGNGEAGSDSGQPETGQPQTGEPQTGQPEVAKPESGEATPVNPAAINEGDTQPTTVPTVPETGAKPVEIEPTPPVEVMASGGNNTEATPVTGGNPVEVLPTAGGADSSTGNTANSWPVAQATKEEQPANKKEGLTRFGEGLMVGGVAKGIAGAKAMDGVMPGSRAFAQLHNGNYFIGKVKHVADETITLRVETGEVTLATAEIATLTRLGTTDYDELQKATKGFVRLTNNNRLIGGILSRIADDHIVLEFRSNRVMLPKSAIGEIVSGKSSDGKVRLGTTSEEDNWVRSLAERQLGTGQGVPVKPDGSTLPVSTQPPR